MRRRLKAFAAIIMVLLCARMTSISCSAEEIEYFIICDPKSHVNVRRTPKMSGEEIGWLECGDMVWSDGIRKNGFLHCFLNIEAGDGWVYAKYLTEEQPTRGGGVATVLSNGRVACRQYINGKRQGWLKPNQTIKILAYTSEWALTKKGFVKMEYLEFDNE